MGFKAGAFAKIWTDPEEGNNGKTCKVRLSVSRKDKTTGQYNQDFGDYVLLIGSAHDAGMSLKAGDRIRLDEVDVSNRYDKENDRKLVTYKVFAFTLANDSIPGGAPQTRNNTANTPAHATDAGPNEDELPF